MTTLLSLDHRTGTRTVGRLSDGSDHTTEPMDEWVATVEADDGSRHTRRFSGPSQPTDDEILAGLPTGVRRLRPSVLAERLELVAERAVAWNALRDAAAEAATDAAFTAPERSRLVLARDLARDRLRQVV